MTVLPIPEFTNSLPETISFIRELVELESPSTDKRAVDKAGLRLISELTNLGAEISVTHSSRAGDMLKASWGNDRAGILLLFHLDTVFELGTIAKNPFRQAKGRIYGPGVLDMKSSIGMFISVMRIFKYRTSLPNKRITALFTTDEEIGSVASRVLIENEAKESQVVFCMEPALSTGALKTSRKGTGDITIKVKGIAAHAGVDHKKGRNAIHELAYHILDAQKLTNYDLGTTVNTGLIHGGTRANVVPEEASAVIDFRVSSLNEFERLKSWTKNINSMIDGTVIISEIQLNRPPMTRDATMTATFHKAWSIGQQLDIDLTEGSTGGGSDANFVAAMGIPVLDGLGPVGGGAHSEREFVQIPSLSERSALLAALLLNW